jgi:endonuclease/exonuclease/phosphatase family metal-dependent hydrolase
VSRIAAVLSLLALLASSLAACAPAVRLVADAGVRPCASAVTGEGEPSAVPIGWIRPEQARDLAELDAWCDAVGPAVIVAGGARPAPVVSGTMAIITWNARVGGGDLEGLVGALRAGALSDGRRIEHFVLLVQEAFRSGSLVPERRRGRAVPSRIAPVPRSGRRVDVLHVAERLGLELYYVPSMRNGPGDAGGMREDRGNAILSTLPLSDFEAIELPFERQRRVAIGARVTGATSGGEPWAMRVVSVHLDNRAGARRLWVGSAAARARQASALVRHLPTDLPLVLGGDLNTWMGSSEPALAIIREALPSRAGRVDGRPTFAAGLRLDFLFERVPEAWRMRQQRVEDRFASDHHPVMGELRIP